MGILMDMGKQKGWKGLIIKTWERCRSICGNLKKPSGIPFVLVSKNRSWSCNVGLPDNNNKCKKGNRIVPKGCFFVYVGPQKQQFLVKIEYANHPLFKILLEQAELEYGYNSEGPLALPCNVDVFCNVLLEIDGDEIRPGCNFMAKGYGSLPSQVLDDTIRVLNFHVWDNYTIIRDEVSFLYNREIYKAM